jgi:tetratricopeptide (TPR) repeat protein
MTVQARVYNNQQNPAALPTAARAVALIKPLAEAPNASVAARASYVEALAQLGFQQANSISQTKDSVPTLQLAMRTAADLGGRDLTNIEMAAQYAEAGGWLTTAFAALGRSEDASRVGADASAVAEKVLDLRPGYILALHAQQLLLSGLAGIALVDMRPAEAADYGKRSAAVSLTLIKLDSKNTVSFNNMAVTYAQIGDAQWSAGHLRESLDSYSQSLEAVGHASNAGATFILLNTLFPAANLVARQADLGDTAAANVSLAFARREAAHLHQLEPNSRVLPVFGQCLISFGEGTMALLRGDATNARRLEREAISRAQGITPHGPSEDFWKAACITFAVDLSGQAEYMLGDPAATEKSMREALEMHKRWPTHNDFDRRDEARMATLLAMALAREGRAADAQRVITQVVKFHRELAARNHGDEFQHVELASALYAQALADKHLRPALLKEADALVSALPAQIRDLRSVRLWRDRIREEVHARTAASARGALQRAPG